VRPTALVALLAVLLAGCAGGGEAGGTGAAAPAADASTAASGASAPAVVVGGDERTYEVATAPAPLRLDDIAVRVLDVRLRPRDDVVAPPPGTVVYARLRLAVRNLGDRTRRVLPTQLWLLDTAGNTYLAGTTHDDDALVGRRVAPGATVRGTIVFPLPTRRAATLLVYRFADAAAIARAGTAGLIQLER
jgi:hypothetical protein